MLLLQEGICSALIEQQSAPTCARREWIGLSRSSRQPNHVHVQDRSQKLVEILVAWQFYKPNFIRVHDVASLRYPSAVGGRSSS